MPCVLLLPAWKLLAGISSSLWSSKSVPSRLHSCVTFDYHLAWIDIDFAAILILTWRLLAFFQLDTSLSDTNFLLDASSLDISTLPSSLCPSDMQMLSLLSSCLSLAFPWLWRGCSTCLLEHLSLVQTQQTMCQNMPTSRFSSTVIRVPARHKPGGCHEVSHISQMSSHH